MVNVCTPFENQLFIVDLLKSGSRNARLNFVCWKQKYIIYTYTSTYPSTLASTR